MLIGWALFAASASAQERYPLPGAGQPTGNGDAQLGNFGNGAGGERAGSAGTPFDQPAASPAADSRAATGAATTTEP
ncbi:MAG TPA: hypothetical protein VHU84_18975, partial [Lacipirellulaceae bacterium]|nr:hypothetical protein [Lacipirellulaceae bacterium]